MVYFVMVSYQTTGNKNYASQAADLPARLYSAAFQGLTAGLGCMHTGRWLKL